MDIMRKKNSRVFLVAFLLSMFILTSNSAMAFEKQPEEEVEELFEGPPPEEFFEGPPEGAHRGPHKGSHGKGKRDEVISKMNLTPKQKNEIIETQEIQKNQLGKLRRALRDNRSELADELGKDKLNFDDIKVVTDKIKDLQGQLIDNRISHFVRMKKVLTKEQMNELLNSYRGKKQD